MHRHERREAYKGFLIITYWFIPIEGIRYFHCTVYLIDVKRTSAMCIGFWKTKREAKKDITAYLAAGNVPDWHSEENGSKTFTKAT